MFLFYNTDLFFQFIAGLFLHDGTHFIAESQHIGTGGTAEVDHKAAVLFTDGCPAHAETAQTAVLD